MSGCNLLMKRHKQREYTSNLNLFDDLIINLPTEKLSHVLFNNGFQKSVHFSACIMLLNRNMILILIIGIENHRNNSFTTITFYHGSLFIVFHEQ